MLTKQRHPVGKIAGDKQSSQLGMNFLINLIHIPARCIGFGQISS